MVTAPAATAGTIRIDHFVAGRGLLGRAGVGALHLADRNRRFARDQLGSGTDRALPDRLEEAAARRRLNAPAKWHWFQQRRG